VRVKEKTKKKTYVEEGLKEVEGGKDFFFSSFSFLLFSSFSSSSMGLVVRSLWNKFQWNLVESVGKMEIKGFIERAKRLLNFFIFLFIFLFRFLFFFSFSSPLLLPHVQVPPSTRIPSPPLCILSHLPNASTRKEREKESDDSQSEPPKHGPRGARKKKKKKNRPPTSPPTETTRPPPCHEANSMMP